MLRIKDQLKDSLKALKTHFKELQSRQADAIQRHPDKSVSQLSVSVALLHSPADSSTYYFPSICYPRNFNDNLLKLYANITKQDLVMNNLVVRARSLTRNYSVEAVSPCNMCCYRGASRVQDRLLGLQQSRKRLRPLLRSLLPREAQRSRRVARTPALKVLALDLMLCLEIPGILRLPSSGEA